MTVLGFGFAALIGLSLGMMGGGGSILTVPVFVYALGFAAKPAIAMSLPVVGMTSLVGAIGHWRNGNVHLRTALLFGAMAMIGSFAGARLAVFLSGAVQLTLLALVMLAAAIAMLRSARGVPTGASDVGGKQATTAKAKLLSVGLAVGVLTGVVGIGGGFLIVPALVVLGRVPMKEAVGTSLLVIAMNSVSGFAGYYGTVEIEWGLVAAFTAVAIGGIIVGTYLVRFVSAMTLKRSFAVFLLMIGAFMLYQNRSVFAGEDHQSATVPPRQEVTFVRTAS